MIVTNQTRLRRSRVLTLLLLIAISCLATGPESAVVAQTGNTQTQNADTEAEPGPRWYRGNLHTHSFWSDGNDFPEMIARWYVDRGYHFLALSDHNILARGEKWMSVEQIQNRGGDECMEKYRAAFDNDWVQTREVDGESQVRLSPLSEFRELFEKPGEFLLIEAEEISDSVDNMPVHLNASNLAELLQPTGGATVREAIDANLRAAAEQASQSGRQILVHLNHPNFGWAVTAEDLAAVTRERFFEVYNGHPSINHQGDKDHPSVERMWDIINTLRIDKLDGPPLYGLGTDDSHHYHGVKTSRPGRGWVMVKAHQLTADELIKAMYRGDFYASSGIELSSVVFDQETKELSIEIVASEGVTYETQFIGTRRGYDEKSTPRLGEDGKPVRSTRIYSSDIGEVLATDVSTHPRYKLTGDELYIRAVVTSSEAHPDPSFTSQRQQAWTQPIGWQQ